MKREQHPLLTMCFQANDLRRYKRPVYRSTEREVSVMGDTRELWRFGLVLDDVLLRPSVSIVVAGSSTRARCQNSTV